MDPESYKLAWSLYLGGGVVFSLLSWRVLHRYLWLELAYLLQCLLMAVMFVPAPVTAGDPSVLAPALIVFTLDTLTIDPTATAGIEALTRLVVGMVGAVVAAVVLSIAHRAVARHFRPHVAVEPASAAAEPASAKSAPSRRAAAENARVEPTLSSPTPPPKRPSQGGASAPLRKRPQRPV
jgi:hypothetical protein